VNNPTVTLDSPSDPVAAAKECERVMAMMTILTRGYVDGAEAIGAMVSWTLRPRLAHKGGAYYFGIGGIGLLGMDRQ
jgi:hypothetical protein